MWLGTTFIAAGILYFARTLSNYTDQAERLIKKHRDNVKLEIEAALAAAAAKAEESEVKDCLADFTP